MSSNDSRLRYQVDEKPPVALALGLGLQLTALSVSATILITTVVMRAAGQGEAYLSWAVFAAVAIGGAASMLQTFQLWRFGMGHVLMMGSSGAFIAVCIKALAEGGPGTLATLVVVSAFFQFVISHRLSLFRRVLTPTVSGTVLMLIPVSVMSPILNLLKDVPDGSPALGAPMSALATVLVICGLTLKTSGFNSPMGLCARYPRRLAGRRFFRSLRHSPSCAGRLGRSSPGRMAGTRSRLRAAFLVASSRIPAGGHDRLRPDNQ